MKHKKINIRWHLFIWLFAFVAVTITLLWVFQTIFLDDFYKLIKTSEIKSAASSISESLNDEDAIYTIAKNNEIDVLICDQNRNTVFSSNEMNFGYMPSVNATPTSEFIQKAEDNGGVYFEVFEMQQENSEFRPDKKEPADLTPPSGDADKHDMQVGKYFGEGILYVKIADDGLAIIISSRITPVTATVNTLKIQLICVTVILIAVAGLLAVLISTRISKPIEKINESAKELAKANYETTFEVNGCREIAELGQTLNYAATELNKTETLRRELIANVSHDLRTPLTLITGYGEAMRDLPGENNTENIQIIIDESRRLTTLVNDMLDLSKLQDDAQSFSIERFSLTELVCDSVARFSKLVAADGISVDFSPSEEAFVEADKIKISQVMYNFLTNAVNYGGEDKKIIIVQKIINKAVRIEVVDHGEGIDENELPYIWDRYYKSEKTHKRAVVGSGIGLSIVKNILEKQNASYGVESIFGKGSTFWFEMKTV